MFCGLQHVLEGKGQRINRRPSQLSGNERQSEPEAVFSGDTCIRKSQLQAWQGATFFEGQNLALKNVCKIILPNQEPVQPSFGTFL